MIPLILVSKNKKEINQFIEKKIKATGAILIKVKRQKTEYSIDEIKEINREAHIYHQKLRIYFLEDFHLSSLPAQNAFLKLLEEPPINIQFILTVTSTYHLLPTITSRAKIVKLGKMTKDNNKDETKDFLNQEIENIVNKKAKKIPFSSFIFTKKDDSIDFLEKLIILFKKRLAIDKNSPLIIKEIIKVRNFVEKNNLNPQLAIDHLLIFIYKCYNGIKR